jgi:cell division protein ZapE
MLRASVMNLREPATRESPRGRYEADLGAGAIAADPAQRGAVDCMERLHRELGKGRRAGSGGFVERLFGRRRTRWEPARGVYLWGKVGRGKTYIVDTFYDCLTFEEKRRIHFHSFMRRTHDALKGLRDQSDPLKRLGAAWAEEHRVLCLDEFHVGDITDAMLLANLLEALFDHGVTLVATSNEAPDELYANGLQRERFLPAIDLIKQHLEVFELSGDLDYRLRALEQAPVYYHCAAGEVRDKLEKSFLAIAPEIGACGVDLVVEGRSIPTVRLADGVAWFGFDVLCGGPRSTIDYIEIARCHHTVIVSDVPRLGRDDNDAARRFVNLVDEIYDRNVNLIVSAAAEPEDLYHGGRLAKPFLRTASRLREMRSHDYLARPHITD